MQGTTLRELAHAFAKGELGRDEYRRNRTNFVAAVLAGEVAVKNVDFPPPIRPPGGDGVDATEPRSRRRRVDSTQEPESTTQITPARPRPAAPASAGKKSPGYGRLIAGVVVVLVATAAAWYFATRPSAEPAAAAGAAGTPPAAAAAAITKDDPRAEAGGTLISQFLQDRNWSAARMASFQAEWSALDVEQRTAALNSAAAGRLASAIYQRLLEERALSGLGDAEGSLAKQRELVGLATAVGITDARLSVPEPAAATEAAAASPDTSATD